MSRYCTLPGSVPVMICIESLPLSWSLPWSCLAWHHDGHKLHETAAPAVHIITVGAAGGTGLQVLHPTLQKLHLYASAQIVDEPAWGRLTSLHALLLQWPRARISSHYQGCGLAKLPALRDLSIDRGPPTNSAHSTDRLLGKSFSSPHLTALRFETDPFEGKLDLCKLPRLTSIISLCLKRSAQLTRGTNIILSCGVCQYSAANH